MQDVCSEIPEEGNMQIKSVYHSLDSILRVLRREEFKVLPEVQELVKVFEANYAPRNEEQPRNKPFIVLEGLDASGKTTICEELTSVLQAEKRSTPPKCLLPLREKFDPLPVPLRRAYYGLGNYLAAQEIEYLCKTKSVIVDRFWHSTAAYTIAHELKGGGKDALPPRGDSLYNWPQDLLEPNLLFFLNVSEEVRNERHSKRNLSSTEEEIRLKDDATFREIVTEAYMRMDNPPLTIVDAEQSESKVVETIMQCVRECSLKATEVRRYNCSEEF